MTATFVNPYAATFRHWDYGFAFRSTSNSTYIVVVQNDGNWYQATYLAGSSTPFIRSGTLGNNVILNRAENGTNTIRIITQGTSGTFVVNGVNVAQLNLGDLTSAGDVGVVAGFFVGESAPGYNTSYHDFTVGP